MSLVVLNWNGQHHLTECLASLQAQTYPAERMEVLLVDNGSTDGSEAWVRAHHPWVQVVQTGANLGSAGGHNAGMRAAQGDAIVLLDNDIVLHPRWLEEVVRASQEPGVGIVGSRVCSYFAPHRVIYPPVRFVPSIARPWSMWAWPLDGASQPVETHAVQSCAMYVKREVVDRIGLTDEGFFFWLEDVDYCLRALRAGFRIRYAPAAVVWHKVSGVSGRLARRPGQFARANLRYMRNFPAWQAPFSAVLMALSLAAFGAVVRRRAHAAPPATALPARVAR